METYIGTNKPIIIEFTYEEWRRLSRLSNKDDQWVRKFYDAILNKAGLIAVFDLQNVSSRLDITNVVLGKDAKKKYEKIVKSKYNNEMSRAFLLFDIGPSEHFKEDDPKINPNQMIVRPEATGSVIWRADVFRK